MLCQHCNENIATTHIKRSINGNNEEMHLCSSCAKELGVMDDFRMPSFEEMFGESLLGALLGTSPSGANAIAGVDRCSTCGSSFSDIVNSGRIGCSDCYKKFEQRLEPSMRKIHGKTKHIGKYISYTQNDESKKSNNEKSVKKDENSIESLKNQLKSAVEEQRFEDAAQLRDKINELEGSDE
ncbi:MAG: UvrB/UvrC motif-containing protein [Eubacterium sp.]|nr:UvrB/UvrC motif-containing protein [Eubacterium sp.]